MKTIKAGLDRLIDDVVQGMPRKEFVKIFYGENATEEDIALADEKVDADIEENGYGMSDCLADE